MSKPIQEQILNNPRLVLSEFKLEDIQILTNTLKSTANQILCKFGYMQRTDKDINTLTKEEVALRGYDKYTIEEIFNRMPNETKTMFWAVNNAGYLLEIEKRLREKREQENKLLMAEILGYQIQIIELQKEIEELKCKNNLK
tara:strand:+ start:20932 stop:21357 length:426 start_codon:yes stop_codon:yes gene_type:complete